MENNSASPTSPDSATSFAPNAFPVVLTVLCVLGALAILFFGIILGAVIFMLVEHSTLAQLTQSLTGIYGIEIQSLAEILVIGYLFAVVPVLGRCTLRDLGFHSIPSRDWLTVLGAVIGMFVVVTAIGSLFENVFHVKQPEEAIKVFTSLHGSSEKALFAVFAIVVGPFSEEMFFRVFLFNAFRKWWGLRAGVIASALLFGVAHVQPGPPALLVSLVISLGAGGVILALIYNKTKSAWANIITHGCFNALSLLAIVVAPQLAK